MKMKNLFAVAMIALVVSFGSFLYTPNVFAADVTVKAEPVTSPEAVKTTPAPAQAVATIPVNPGSTIVDLSSGLDLQGILSTLALGIALGVLAVYKWAKNKWSFVEKLLPEEEVQKYLSPLLDEAVAFGVGKLKDADWLKVDTKNQVIATAVTYALEHGGALLAKFGISNQQLREKLEAKLVQNGWDKEPGKWEA